MTAETKATLREAIADAFISIAPSRDFLSKPTVHLKSGYLPLCVQVAKSAINKNAVSIHDDYVSFMVPDWSMRPQVQNANLDLEAKENTEMGHRLHVYGLTPHKIKSNPDSLMTKLLTLAKEESISRQTHKSPRIRNHNG
jgi:hypothetical protein